MTVIMVEELAQAVFVFGAVLCVVVIDVAIDDFDVLGIVGDVECGELYIAEMDTNDFSLTDTLDEGVIFIEESLPEVLVRVFLKYSSFAVYSFSNCCDVIMIGILGCRM